MTAKFYPAILEPDGKDGYGVAFIDFPGCVTGGDTMQEAATNAIEALIFHVESMIADEMTIPEPSPINVQAPYWLLGVDLSRTIRMPVPLDIDARTQRINIVMEEGLLARIDRVAEARGMNRSAFLSEAARRMLRDAP